MFFKNRKLNREKILGNGFELVGENFIRREKFLDDFTLTISIDGRGSVTTKIFDADGEPYTLHLVEDAVGSFVGAVKAEHERILKKISEECFDEEIFHSAQATRLVEHIREFFWTSPNSSGKNFRTSRSSVAWTIASGTP